MLHNTYYLCINFVCFDSLGNYGACFKPDICRPEDAILYVSRPGLRLWKSNISGVVLNTFMFRDLLNVNTPTIVVLPETAQDNLSNTIEENSFGVLQVHLLFACLNVLVFY